MKQADFKDYIARGLLATQAWRLLSRSAAGKSFCVIVNFHSIVDQNFKGLKKGPSVHTPVSAFEKFLAYATRILNPISLDRLVEHIDGDKPLADNSIAITFDDGFQNNLRIAAPVLSKYRCPATVFLPVDYIGSGKMLPMDRVSAIFNQTDRDEIVVKMPAEMRLLCDSVEAKARSNALLSVELKKRPSREWPELIDQLQHQAGLSSVEVENPMLTWEEASELPGLGISVGSHGCTHRLMTALSREDAGDELLRSRNVIETKLGTAPRHFAYPNGRAIDFDDELRNEARRVGYLSVLSCERNVTVIGRSKSNNLGRFGLVGKPAHSMIYLLQSAARQLS